MSQRRQRQYALLLALGASILLYRTLAMIDEGSLSVLVAWVSALLLLEAAVDLTTLTACLRWWRSGQEQHASTALRLGAGAALLHAFRVLIFVMGRTGPWFDFDVRPEERAFHAARWTWGEVYFAAAMSMLGVIGVLVIWQTRRRSRRLQAD